MSVHWPVNRTFCLIARSPPYLPSLLSIGAISNHNEDHVGKFLHDFLGSTHKVFQALLGNEATRGARHRGFAFSDILTESGAGFWKREARSIPVSMTRSLDMRMPE